MNTDVVNISAVNSTISNNQSFMSNDGNSTISPKLKVAYNSMNTIKELKIDPDKRNSHNKNIIRQIANNLKTITDLKERKILENLNWRRITEFCYRNFDKSKFKVLLNEKWANGYRLYIDSGYESSKLKSHEIEPIANIPIIKKIAEEVNCDREFHCIDYEIYYFLSELYGGGPFFELEM